jgi:hypothetical protein
VEVASVELHAGGALEVEMRHLRVFDDGLPEPAASVDRVVARLRWPRLLAGQLLPATWTLEKPVLNLRPTPDGAGAPELPFRPLEVTVRDGTVFWGENGDGAVELRNIQISARAPPLSQSVRGTALGQVKLSGRTLASFSVEFKARSEGLEARGSVSGCELSALPIPGLPPLQGSAAGTVSARWTPEGREASVDLEVSGLAFDHPALTSPIAPQETHLSADIREQKDSVEVRLRPLRLDDLSVRGTIEVGGDPEARVRADLSIDAFRLGLPDGRLQLLRLVGKRHAIWARADQRTEGGRIEGLSFRLDVPRELLGETLLFDRKTRRHELYVEARIRDGVYRPSPESAPLEDLNATVRVRGNRLEVYDLVMNREGRPLPEIDVTIDGLHRFAHLPKLERRTPKGPQVPIPGIGPAFAALSEVGPPDRERAPMILRDARVGYPAFVLPIRDATATIWVDDGNLLVQDLEGVVGGIPAQVQALWSPSENTVLVQVTYGDGEVEPAPQPDVPWIDGKFALETAYLGSWRLDDVEGEFRGSGSRIQLPRIEGTLAGGPIRLDGALDLDKSGHAPVALNLDLKKADAAKVGEMLGLEDGTLAGELGATGTLTGPLRPGTPFIAEGEIDLEAKVQNGKLGNLGVTVTLARLATPLGWTGLFGRPLPVKNLETSLQVHHGMLNIKDFTLVGSELRMLAAGHVGLLDEERPVNLLVALLLFQSADRVLENVPVIGDWILGEDRSLVALYFRLEGPWGNPEGSYVPPQTLRAATGWAERIIVGGVRRLRDLIIPGGGESKN